MEDRPIFFCMTIISYSNQHFESVTWLSCSFGGFPNEYVICMFLSYGMPTFLRYFWDPSFGKFENSPCAAMDYAKTLVKNNLVTPCMILYITAEIVSLDVQLSQFLGNILCTAGLVITGLVTLSPLACQPHVFNNAFCGTECEFCVARSQRPGWMNVQLYQVYKWSRYIFLQRLGTSKGSCQGSKR